MGRAEPSRRLQVGRRRLSDTGDARAAGSAAPRVATVVPDVTGLDKQFDYLIPFELSAHVRVGTLVRVELHGRRIGGWVAAIGDTPTDGRTIESLKSIAKVTGHGPAAELFELAQWASTRWATRRIRPFLVTASPGRAVVALPPDRRTGATPGPTSPATRNLLGVGGGVLRLPPRADVMPTILAAVGRGPSLVVVPEHHTVALLATRLRRAGLSVAVVPDDWASAAGGVDVVIGTRSAAWAPCPDLAVAVVVDEHDEVLQEERTPTWHARDVVVERCRRAGVPYVLVSPTPTLTAVVEYAGDGGVVHPPAARERSGWPRIVVVDRTDEDPWKRSLVTSPLIERLRDHDLTVVCVSNITGRARVLACRSCRALIRCEECDAAVGLDDDGRLSCRRCRTVRPPVCQACGASRFANLRPGVTRLHAKNWKLQPPVPWLQSPDPTRVCRPVPVSTWEPKPFSIASVPPMWSPSSSSTPRCSPPGSGRRNRRWHSSFEQGGWHPRCCSRPSHRITR